MSEVETRQPTNGTIVVPFAEVDTPTVNSTFCLNARQKSISCTRCADSCPTSAIHLTTNRLPDLTQDACVSCGACLTTCPTDVFQTTLKLERTLQQTIAQLPLEPIALVCALHPTPQQSIAPTSTVVQHRRCLAALDPATLLELSNAGQRPLWLDDLPCTTCTIGSARHTIQQGVTVAQAILGSCGYPDLIKLTSQLPSHEPHSPQRREWIDGGQPKLSRRGLFNFVRRTIDQNLEPIETKAQVISEQPAFRQRLPQSLPPSRIHLIAQLQRLFLRSDREFTTKKGPFTSVTVNTEECSGCSCCAIFCPTAALQFESTKDTFHLAFRASHCIDCGICLAACPEDAVSLHEDLSLAELHNHSPLSLVSGPLVPCATCGVPTASRTQDANSPRCHSCRQGAGAVTTQRDEAGLMADLLNRIKWC